MRVIDYFDKGADLHPDTACLVSGSDTRSYQQVRQSTHRIARALIREGVATTEVVGVLSPNNLSAFEALLGVFRADAVWAPVSHYNSAETNAEIINRFGLSVLFFHSSTADNVRSIEKSCPRLRLLVCVDQPVEGYPFLDDWMETGDALAPERPHDGMVTLSSTGGTTGLPKGVVWGNETWETLVANFNSSTPPGAGAVHLVAAPMMHAAGPLAIMTMPAGTTTIVLPKFDPLEVMQAIEKHRVTMLFLPPAAIYMMLGHPRVREFDYSTLRNLIFAAAPMAPDKFREAIDVFGPVLTTGFGQVEAPATCTIMTPNEIVRDGVIQEDLLTSCGRPHLLSKVAIMDDDGNLLGADEIGEVVVRSNLVMRGYFNNPEATAEVSKFGWHHTGDIGYRNQAGYYFIVDRKKDMIISGGLNVYSAEVEKAILNHDGIMDCAVIGVPDAKWGEAVKAVVELKSNSTVTEEEIIAFVKKQLGSVKTPKSIDFVDHLPRTGAGKIDKKSVRAPYWENHKRRI